MSHRLTLDEMKSAMRNSQATLLSLVHDASPGSGVADTSLYHNHHPESWASGVVMLHLSEAREHFASDIERLVTSNFTIGVGRTMQHEGRVAAIQEAASGKLGRAAVRVRLVESHDTIMAALEKLQEQDLDRTVVNQNPKFGEQPLWDFIGHFVVGHDNLHAEQAKATNGQ